MKRDTEMTPAPLDMVVSVRRPTERVKEDTYRVRRNQPKSRSGTQPVQDLGVGIGSLCPQNRRQAAWPGCGGVGKLRG